MVPFKTLAHLSGNKKYPQLGIGTLNEKKFSLEKRNGVVFLFCLIMFYLFFLSLSIYLSIHHHLSIFKEGQFKTVYKDMGSRAG